MATISIPKNIRKSGKVIVVETPAGVSHKIAVARAAKIEMITLNEVTTINHVIRAFTVKWSLIQAIEP